MSIIACVLGFAAPPLAAAEAGKNLGELRAGPVALTTVALANRGAAVLTVLDVEGGCGCVRPRVEPLRLEAGATSQLHVAWNTLAQPEGSARWRVRVRYSDGDTIRVLEVPFSATLVRDVSITPPAVTFSTTGTASQTLVVADRRAKPLKVTSAASTWEPLDVELDGAKVHVLLKANAPVGHQDAEVILTTDDPAYKELRVAVRVAKRSGEAATASPAELALAGADLVGRVVVRSPTGARVRIERVESDEGRLQFRWSKESGATAVVRVEVDAGTHGTAEVRIRLAEPAGHVVTLPVSWRD